MARKDEADTAQPSTANQTDVKRGFMSSWGQSKTLVCGLSNHHASCGAADGGCKLREIKITYSWRAMPRKQNLAVHRGKLRVAEASSSSLRLRVLKGEEKIQSRGGVLRNAETVVLTQQPGHLTSRGNRNARQLRAPPARHDPRRVRPSGPPATTHQTLQCPRSPNV